MGVGTAPLADRRGWLVLLLALPGSSHCAYPALTAQNYPTPAPPCAQPNDFFSRKWRSEGWRYAASVGVSVTV